MPTAPTACGWRIAALRLGAAGARQRLRPHRQLPHRARRGRAEAAVGHLVGQGREVWGIYGRYFEGGRWSAPQRITGDAGPNLYPRRGARFERQAAPGLAGLPRADRLGFSTRPGMGRPGRARMRSATGERQLGRRPAAADERQRLDRLGWIRQRQLRHLRPPPRPRRAARSAPADHALPRLRRQCVPGLRPLRQLWISWDCGRGKLGQGLEQPAFQPRAAATASTARAPCASPRSMATG